MADVVYQLGNPILLNQMIPVNTGVPTEVPAALTATPGLYLILNQQDPLPSNRYMGISTDIRQRFQSRQGACFELGFARNKLDDIAAFIGTMKYRNHSEEAWIPAPGYEAGHLTINLNGNNYDLEHLFIKSAQNIWPTDTISNTLKVGTLTNAGNERINVKITWQLNGEQSKEIVIPAGGELPR